MTLTKNTGEESGEESRLWLTRNPYLFTSLLPYRQLPHPVFSPATE